MKPQKVLHRLLPADFNERFHKWENSCNFLIQAHTDFEDDGGH